MKQSTQSPQALQTYFSDQVSINRSQLGDGDRSSRQLLDAAAKLGAETASVSII